MRKQEGLISATGKGSPDVSGGLLLFCLPESVHSLLIQNKTREEMCENEHEEGLPNPEPAR